MKNTLPNVYIIGIYSTRFKKWLDSSMKDLTRQTYLGVLADAKIKDGGDIEFAWFGSCSMGILWDQDFIRGHTCLSPLVEEGLFPERVPIINVEGACATASLAFHAAWKDILSGQCKVSLAMGVDKLYHPDMEKMLLTYEHGIDRSEKKRLMAQYREIGAECGRKFETGINRTLFIDTYAMQACWHMHKYGTTQAQIAKAASKSHYHGSLNPKAQYRFEVPVEKVLADYQVSYPLTRSMCAPIGDGGAAAILCSEDYFQKLPDDVKRRAVRVAASVVTSGKHRKITEPSLSKYAADKAYAMAGIGPRDINVAEVHDACSFCEIYQAEMLGFCSIGEGGAFVESGATALDGKIPMNTSGGLVSKGHPVGATGLSMIDEIVTQLRQEAGKRQVKSCRYGLSENGGGVISSEEFSCCVNILEKA
ncbi:MAG: thiolase family protein [Desulfobacteraceae bacterium]|nr:thiolase family protein [Desulfobacteraceae bacterium]